MRIEFDGGAGNGTRMRIIGSDLGSRNTGTIKFNRVEDHSYDGDLDDVQTFELGEYINSTAITWNSSVIEFIVPSRTRNFIPSKGIVKDVRLYTYNF